MYLYINVFSLLFTLSIIGCSEENSSACEQNQIDVSFENSFDEWIAAGGSGERAFDEDITISSEYAFSGSHSVKFTVKPESYVAGGNRAELTFDDLAIEGDEKWYSWKMYIPENYPDVPMRDNDQEPNWQLMGQWHQQPVVEDGETWENFTGQGESPSVGFNYYFLSADDPYYQQMKNDDRLLSVHGFDPSWNNIPVLFLTYGTPPVPIAIAPVQKGAWLDILVRIGWSEGDNGYIQCWLNGSEMTDGTFLGKNMWNKASHYFKFGLYKNPDIPHTNTIYYDDIRIGFCKKEVE